MGVYSVYLTGARASERRSRVSLYGRWCRKVTTADDYAVYDAALATFELVSTSPAVITGWLGANSVRFSPTHLAARFTDSSAPSLLSKMLTVASTSRPHSAPPSIIM